MCVIKIAFSYLVLLASHCASWSLLWFFLHVAYIHRMASGLKTELID
jgi:hypothetical protein